ncbi:MAG: hypothetical protein RL134_571, partial [Actinomycetota bacterium]
VHVSFAGAILIADEPVPVARTADAVADTLALGLMLGLAEAAGAEAIVSAPKAKAPAATPASARLPERIALDNAFPFVNACPLFGPPGAEGSISVIPGRNERQAR